MMRAGAAAPLELARERADAPRRSAAGDAEWRPLSALANLRAEWRDLAGRASPAGGYLRPERVSREGRGANNTRLPAP